MLITLFLHINKYKLIFCFLRNSTHQTDPSQSNISDHVTVGSGGVPGSEQTTKDTAEALDSNAPVEGVFGRKRYVAGPGGHVVVAD